MEGTPQGLPSFFIMHTRPQTVQLLKFSKTRLCSLYLRQCTLAHKIKLTDERYGQEACSFYKHIPLWKG